MSASVVTIDSRLTDDSVDNVAERHTPETTPDKFSEHVASSHLSVAMPDGFHDARLFVCVCGEEFEAADFGLLHLVPASPLQPAWRTEIKGYSINGYSFVDPTGRRKAGETFGSWAHCPMDRKLLTEKSKHIAPGDDAWMARLLRRRLEQGLDSRGIPSAQQDPPEWSTWFHGFGWRDGGGVLHDWEGMSFHFREKSTVFSWRDADDVLHVDRRPAELVKDATWRPKNTKERGHPKPLQFYDLPFVKQTADVCRCSECRQPLRNSIKRCWWLWHFQVTVHSNRRFKGPVKDAAKTWAYPLERYEIESENVPTIVEGGCVYVIGNKIDGERVNSKRHGITGWIRSQSKPRLNQDIKLHFITTKCSSKYREKSESIASGYLYRDIGKKRLHRGEVQELEKSRCLKVKGNTGGWQPLRALDDFYDWRQEEMHQEQQQMLQEEKRQQQMRRESGFTTSFDEAESSTEMVWDGDDFTLVDDKPEYFACQIDERGRGRNKTSDERWQEDEAWKTKRAEHEATLEAGRGWSPADPKKDTRFLPSGVKYNLSNPVVKQILYEIDQHRQNFDSRKKLAAENNLKYETARKKELKDINMKKECPNTPFTAEQMKDFNARGGRVVYVHAITDKPRWYRLDMDRFETYQEAIEAVKRKGKDKALKQIPMWNNPRAPKDKFNQALREVVARWDEYFWRENIYILDLRSPMVVVIAEDAWEPKGD